MKNFLVAFVIFLFWSFFGLWLYSWLQPNSDAAVLEPKEAIKITKLDSTYTIPKVKIEDSIILSRTKKDTISATIKESNKEITTGLKATNEEGDIIFSFIEGIQIIKNSSNVIIPNTIIDYKYKLNTYLLEHPNKEVHIHSLYSPKENILSPNIGEQRGKSLSLLLINFGIPKEKLVIKPVIKDLEFNKENIYNNSIYFTFHELDTKRIELLKKEEPKSRLVYPKFSDSGILVNADLKTLLGELILYFNENPNKEIEIVGHTDNIGSELDNHSIGLKYAKQVRWYLTSKGDFNPALLKAISKGETEPIGDNNTSKGRIANRRVEIIFK